MGPVDGRDRDGVGWSGAGVKGAEPARSLLTRSLSLAMSGLKDCQLQGQGREHRSAQPVSFTCR